MRWSKPSKRAERSVSAGSRASSSTRPWSSGRPAGVSATTRCSGRPAVHRVESGGHHIHAEHHSGPSAVGLVVDLAGAERSRVAVVEDVQLELAPEHGRDGPAFLEPLEGTGDQREDVQSHQGCRGYPRSEKPGATTTRRCTRSTSRTQSSTSGRRSPVSSSRASFATPGRTSVTTPRRSPSVTTTSSPTRSAT